MTKVESDHRKKAAADESASMQESPSKRVSPSPMHPKWPRLSELTIAVLVAILASLPSWWALANDDSRDDRMVKGAARMLQDDFDRMADDIGKTLARERTDNRLLTESEVRGAFPRSKIDFQTTLPPQLRVEVAGAVPENWKAIAEAERSSIRADRLFKARARGTYDGVTRQVRDGQLCPWFDHFVAASQALEKLTEVEPRKTARPKGC